VCIIFMQNLIMNKISYNKKIFYTAVQLHPCYCTKKVCRFVPKKIIARGKNICHYKICGVKQKKKYVVVESNSSMLQFHADTKFNEEDYDDGKIPRHIFEFVSYDHLEARIGKDLYTG